MIEKQSVSPDVQVYRQQVEESLQQSPFHGVFKLPSTFCAGTFWNLQKAGEIPAVQIPTTLLKSFFK